jgi:hypothetical protein
MKIPFFFIKKVKVGQKSWVFNIFHVFLNSNEIHRYRKQSCQLDIFFLSTIFTYIKLKKKKKTNFTIKVENIIKIKTKNRDKKMESKAHNHKK